MTDLIPEPALGADAPMRREIGAVTLTERTDVGLASLALRAAASEPAPFGLILPGPGDSVVLQDKGAFWTGPGQWMIEGSENGDFAATVAAEAPGCSVTEQTDGWVVLDLVAPAEALGTLLERLVNLPPEALTPGKATRTLMHHMSVVLIRRSDSRLTVMGMRSLAGSLWHALEDTAARLA
ncbi:sarcosine oxidase subunit gamma [Marinibacterium profundimaris]|uniref:Sarcosine oxidase subunit gamma n=1 Tax=Marinibacterium profundimaris TaxID=1679460 RepID=A0A225NPS1_9RHOB|nr:sarcosine oxidase subunit gamma [Marinibacterium profundimaris]OWU74781.1 sarcosine oxidase subunit gamma [Marinibacterium profundimaris]